MFFWKLYYWLVVFQLIMAYRTSFIEGFILYDFLFFPVALMALIGLQSHVYKLNYFTLKLWKLFFIVYLVDAVIYFSYLADKLKGYDLDQTAQWILIPTFILIILLDIPKANALYRCGYTNDHQHQET